MPGHLARLLNSLAALVLSALLALGLAGGVGLLLGLLLASGRRSH